MNRENKAEKKQEKKELTAIDRLRQSQEKFDHLDVPDFTTKSISFDQGDQSLKYIQEEIDDKKEKESTVPVDSTRVIQKIKRKEPPKKRSSKHEEPDLSLTDTLIRSGVTGKVKLRRMLYQEDEKEQSKLTQDEKKSNSVKFRIILVLCAILLIAGLLVGYAYKTIIYDPQHLVTNSMAKTYKILEGYADEWSMSSQSEKNELLKYQNKYKDLSVDQKQQINAYFKEQTGKKLTVIFSDLKTKEAQKENERLNKIITFLNGWPNYTYSQQATVISYQDDYDALSDAHKKQVNALSQQQTQKTFTKLCKAYKTNSTDTSTQTDDSSQQWYDQSTDQDTMDDTSSYYDSGYSEY